MATQPPGDSPSSGANRSQPEAPPPASSVGARATTCVDPLYCEYYFTDGKWWLVGSSVESGYYCPDHFGKEVEGGQPPTSSYTCIPPVPEPQGSLQVTSSLNVCQYHYRNGSYFLTQCACDSGKYCPADLPAYCRVHGEHSELLEYFQRHPEIIDATIVLPAASIDYCVEKQHSPPHDNLIAHPETD